MGIRRDVSRKVNRCSADSESMPKNFKTLESRMSPESRTRALRLAKRYRAEISPGGEDEGVNQRFSFR